MSDHIIIIVLGNRLVGQELHLELKGRVDTAISLYYELIHLKKECNISILLSGGITNSEIQLSEAEIMRGYCIENGIPKSKTIKEEESLDTIGNALFTRKIIDSTKDIFNIYVISSCYHMNRVEYIFNMCYGNKYHLNFSNCSYSEKPDAAKKEMSSFSQAKHFFKNITAGDLEEIELRLFSIHKLYAISR